MNVISTLKTLGMKCSFVLKRLSNLLKNPNHISVTNWGISIFNSLLLSDEGVLVGQWAIWWVYMWKLILQFLLNCLPNCIEAFWLRTESFGPPIIKCVKLVSLKDNSKLLLEPSSVQQRTNSAPKINLQLKLLKILSIECYNLFQLKLSFVVTPLNAQQST